jgi:excisionase family DNA binding protein
MDEPNEKQPRATMTVPQVADYLGISSQAAYAAVATKEIPSIRIGKRILVPIRALARLLEAADNAANR